MSTHSICFCEEKIKNISTFWLKKAPNIELCFDPEAKKQSMRWKQPGSPTPKKFLRECFQHGR